MSRVPNVRVSRRKIATSAEKEIHEMNTKAAEMNTIAGFDFKTAGADALKLMKSAFDTSFANVVKMQDLTEKMMRDSAELAKSMQADTVKFTEIMIENGKKTRTEYKKAVEEGFKKAEETH
jgi:dihydroxyacetone kinase DhaKLM complex PTS-EIIA-like component DhaM